MFTNKYNKIKAWSFSICLIILGVIFNNLLVSIDRIKEVNSNLSEVKNEVDSMYINNTVRGTQRDILNSIKQSYVKYMESTKETLTIDGKLEQANAKDALNIVASAFDTYGEHGGIVAYDTVTGDVLMNTSSIESLDNIYKTNNSEFIKGHLDSDSKSLKTYSKGISADSVNDFKRYPLGSLDRIFIEKVVLPFEHIGFENSNAKITLISIVSEEDVSKDSVKITKVLESEILTSAKETKKTYGMILIAMFTVLGCVVIILFDYEK